VRSSHRHRYLPITERVASCERRRWDLGYYQIIPKKFRYLQRWDDLLRMICTGGATI